MQPPHVIDHDRHRHFREAGFQVGQMPRVDPQLQMPAEVFHHREEGLDLLEPDTAVIGRLAVAPVFVGAQAADAVAMHRAQRIGRRLAAHHGDAAQPVGGAAQRPSSVQALSRS